MAKAKADETEPKFTKAQILESEKFRKRRDLLGVILNDNKSYTITEVNELMEKYKKGGTK